MKLIDMFFDDIEDAKKRRVPFIIPIGTIEYHAHHLSIGTDTLAVTGCLRELEKEKEIVICPALWYGIASYAVAGPESNTITIDEDVYAAYVYNILKSMLYSGNKNIYMIPFHQTEGEVLMPMTIACHKAAKKVTMEYMEEKYGQGWWGSDDYQNYYKDLGTSDDPFSYIKVVRLMDDEIQSLAGGADHAGEFETSTIMSLYPKNVDITRCNRNTEWFSKTATEASKEAGDEIVQKTVEYLKRVIE